MTKIDIISGFLGAGKTTLIKKLLKEAYKDEQLVLIENEFGEIGIDGGFLKEAGIKITEMNSGCICCSLVGDFGRALTEVIGQYHPDRVLIEPSGVGKLSDVIRAVEGVSDKLEGVELNTFVTVADANKCKMYMKNFGEFFNNQVENANTIILSRTQNMSEEKLASIVELLRGHNPKALIVTTPWEYLTGEQLRSAMNREDSLKAELLAAIAAEHHDDDDEHDEHEHHHHHDDDDDECECGHEHHHHHDDDDHDEHEHHHHHHHADEVFTSWGAETPKKFTDDAIAAALTELDSGKYGAILRAKGIVPASDGGWIHFDYVPMEHDVRRGGAEVTGKLCVIGAKLDEDALKALFGI
ncbi:MAG: CobW family GTP-binding protein [Oscillospiraceae bacterium]|nr:CobW family GTP-binding protein [Oscillospiraceae bacterium]